MRASGPAWLSSGAGIDPTFILRNAS